MPAASSCAPNIYWSAGVAAACVRTELRADQEAAAVRVFIQSATPAAARARPPWTQ